MKTIGILGGLGPESTAEYYRIITRAYYDRCHDYYYPEIVILSLSFGAFIERGYVAPDDVRDAIERLHRAGADFVVAACNSIHVVYDDVASHIPIPWISIMDVVGESIRSKGIRAAALLGTDLTMSGGFYQKALSRYGIETIIPPEDTRKRINEIIFTELVRGIVTGKSKEFALGCIENLVQHGAQGIILGCTELPFLIKSGDTSVPVFDSTEIHSLKALDLALEEGR